MAEVSFDAIPVVDLSTRHDSEARRRDLADRLLEVSHEVGFFVITGHGIDALLIDEVFTLMERFFSLDDSDKALIDKRQSPHFRGWEAVGSEYTNNRIDVREQIDLWSEWPVADDDATYLRLLGPNQWMPADVLPGHRELTQRWMRELGALADDLLRLLAIGLGLNDAHFVAMFGDQPMSLTKMIPLPTDAGRRRGRQRTSRHGLSHAAPTRPDAGSASAQSARCVDRRAEHPGLVRGQPRRDVAGHDRQLPRRHPTPRDHR